MNNSLKMLRLTEIETRSKQNRDFTGMGKWLLLDKPEGIKGWFAYSSFYFCALLALVLKIGGVIAVIGVVHGSSAWLPPIYFTGASLFVLLAFHLHDVSLRFSGSSNQRR